MNENKYQGFWRRTKREREREKKKREKVKSESETCETNRSKNSNFRLWVLHDLKGWEEAKSWVIRFEKKNKKRKKKKKERKREEKETTLGRWNQERRRKFEQKRILSLLSLFCLVQVAVVKVRAWILEPKSSSLPPSLPCSSNHFHQTKQYNYVCRCWSIHCFSFTSVFHSLSVISFVVSFKSWFHSSRGFNKKFNNTAIGKSLSFPTIVPSFLRLYHSIVICRYLYPKTSCSNSLTLGYTSLFSFIN